MPYEAITVTPASPHIGAEIGNIDLTKPLSNQEVSELHQAFTDHLVIFFRDQRISFDDQIRVASYFGPLGRHVGVSTISKTTDNPFVRKFHYDETSTKISGENWHSDQSCAAIPPLGSMLYNHTLPPNGGGDTMFASMYAAYEALSPAMQSLLGGLRAVNSSALADVSKTREDRIRDAGDDVTTATEFVAEHPVVRTHPETGRKGLYVNVAHTARFAGMTEAESKPLLQFLFEHQVRPEFTCRFRWAVGSLAMWDNRCAMHNPINDYHGYTRRMHRITLAGDVPV
jgi:alpha-ketoglutarate-dependent taurine dioxygenase